MFNSKKVFLLYFIISLFSFSSQAKITKESSLTNEQKIVLYKAYSEIEKYYKDDNNTDKNNTLDINNYDTVKFENIVLSIKSFYKSAKIPTENFLETGLSKFIGVIVVLNFFSSYISYFLTSIIFIFLSYYSFRSLCIYSINHEGVLESLKYKDKSYQKLVASKESKELIFYKIIFVTSIFVIIL